MITKILLLGESPSHRLLFAVFAVFVIFDVFLSD
jgi:hypothetical protein